MQEYLNKIKDLAEKIGKEVKLMEVCGTHTQVIAEYGIKKVLPDNIKLLSGPGCPVCVASIYDIDAVVNLAMAGIPIATYGDMVRVKGLKMSLADAREAGAFVKEIYGVGELFGKNTPLAPLKMGNKDVVFFGIGFETTAPMTASIIKRGIKVYSAHRAFIPAMKTLLSNGEIKVDGLISPGHVATITGADVFFEFENKDGLKIPQVITGFEMEDVLKGIVMLLKQILEGRAETENEYARVVKPEGNIKALKLIDEVFEIKNSDWRGLGEIPMSGFDIRKEFADMDAKILYGITLKFSDNNRGLTPPCLRPHPVCALPPVCAGRAQTGGRARTGRQALPFSRGGFEECLCAEVIKGNIEPRKCPMFGKRCAPDNPQGPCMVSREGACSIAYKNI